MHNPLMKSNHKATKLMVFCLMLAMALASTVMPVMAVDAGVGAVMEIVMEILSTASLYVGIIISLWGIFQIILAMRREDSEGISKQIMTIVVGAVLIGFGGFAPDLVASLGG